jgi:hypothetical protein
MLGGSVLLCRDRSTVTQHLFKKASFGMQGRKVFFTKAQADHVMKKVAQYIAKSSRRYQVTYDMVKQRTRTRASTWTVMREFRKRGLNFKKRAPFHKRRFNFKELGETPSLSEEAVQEDVLSWTLRSVHQVQQPFISHTSAIH